MVVFTSHAQTTSTVKAYTGRGPNKYNFWLSTPASQDYELAEPVPLVVFLHGSSLCGNDLNKVLKYGSIAAVNKGLDIDGYVLAPQNPGGGWKPEKVWEVVEYVIDSIANVDTSHIYVLGMSLGGYGTMDVAATYPERIAAAIAMCGGASVKDVKRLNNLPLWIIHGTADTAVSVGQSDKVVVAMKEDDPNLSRLIYDRIPGMNHSEPARLFFLPEIYEWLFTHSLEDDERCITKTFPISNDVMRSAYSSVASKRISLDCLPDYEKKEIE